MPFRETLVLTPIPPTAMIAAPPGAAMSPSPHTVAIAFRQGQIDALARTLFASPALYPAEMRQCFALRPLVRAWSQYREDRRSEEPTAKLQSLMRIWYAVFCLKKKK